MDYSFFLFHPTPEKNDGGKKKVSRIRNAVTSIRDHESPSLGRIIKFFLTMASGFGSGLASVQSDPVVGRCLVAATEISQGAVVLKEKPLGERVFGSRGNTLASFGLC